MSLIGFVADVHLANHKAFGGETVGGINRRCQVTLDVLAAAMDKAAEQEAATFVVLGDLFDTARPSPQVIKAVQEVFGLRDAMRTVVLAGNHDTVSDQPGDHALGPLEAMYLYGDVDTTVVAHEPVGMDPVFYVPWRAGDMTDHLRTVFHGRLIGGTLALHCGIADDKTPPWLRGSPGCVTADFLFKHMNDNGTRVVVAGDWHGHRIWQKGGKTIVQVGTLCPAGWDDAGQDGFGKLVLVDTEKWTVTVEEIPGPRFINLGSNESIDRPVEGCTYYVRRTVPAAELTAARAEMADAVATGFLAGGEVLPDDREARTAARTAATAARAGSTLTESIAGFVGSMGLPDGVSRDDVAARVRRYLEV